MPIAPTFVFARAAHVADLALILALPINPHPAFSIFRFAGRIPLIADGEVQGFRRAEEIAGTARLKRNHSKVDAGQKVKLSEGAFAGITGTVKRVGGQYSLVAFDDFELKIATWLLSTNVVTDDPSPLGSAAKAA